MPRTAILTTPFSVKADSTDPIAGYLFDSITTGSGVAISVIDVGGDRKLLISGTGTASPLTTKGDLYGYDTTNTRIPVGTAGQVLIVDAGEGVGLKWADGATPDAHAASHENTGSDEISVEGLSGLLADSQTPLAHDLSGALHNSTTLANLNLKISDATLDDSSAARTPSTHATSHKSGGGDAIKLDELAAPTDVVTLNASTSTHGLLKKLPNVSTQYMNGQGNWAVPTGIVPSAHAASHKSAGADAIRLDELKAPTDVTTLNASTSVHGLLKKLSNVSTQYMNGVGSWATPSGVVPSAHATSHQSGGSDAIKLDNLATPDDNTDLDATVSYHGLVPKLTSLTTDCFRGDGTYVGVPPWTTYPNDVEEADAIDLVVPVGTAALDPSKRVFRIWWESDVGAETEVFNIKERELTFIATGRAELLGDETDGASAVGTVVGSSVELTVDGSSLLNVQNAGVDKEKTFYDGGKRFCMSDTGGFVEFRYLEELVTVAAAATTDTYIQIPAGCQAVVTCRVVTVIPTAATFSIGDSGSASRWGSGLNVAVGTTNQSVAQTNGFVFFGSDTYITITPSDTPATATGQVRVYVAYMKVGAPTA